MSFSPVKRNILPFGIPIVVVSSILYVYDELKLLFNVTPFLLPENMAPFISDTMAKNLNKGIETHMIFFNIAKEECFNTAKMQFLGEEHHTDGCYECKAFIGPSLETT